MRKHCKLPCFHTPPKSPLNHSLQHHSHTHFFESLQNLFKIQHAFWRKSPSSTRAHHQNFGFCRLCRRWGYESPISIEHTVVASCSSVFLFHISSHTGPGGFQGPSLWKKVQYPAVSGFHTSWAGTLRTNFKIPATTLNILWESNSPLKSPRNSPFKPPGNRALYISLYACWKILTRCEDVRIKFHRSQNSQLEFCFYHAPFRSNGFSQQKMHRSWIGNYVFHVSSTLPMTLVAQTSEHTKVIRR